MMGESSQLLLLFQLADSGFPTGGFAFSHGLEAAVAAGAVDDTATLESYLRAQIDQAGAFDLPFFHGFYDAATTPDTTTLARILEEYHAATTLPTARRASLVQGRGLLRQIASLLDAAACRPLEDFFRKPDHPPHHLAVLATTAAAAQLQRDAAGMMHLFSVVRNSTSAAVRLGLIGPNEGTRIHAALHEHCVQTAERAADRSWQQAARVNPLAEITQGLHDRIYSRLFQN